MAVKGGERMWRATEARRGRAVALLLLLMVDGASCFTIPAMWSSSMIGCRGRRECAVSPRVGRAAPVGCVVACQEGSDLMAEMRKTLESKKPSMVKTFWEELPAMGDQERAEVLTFMMKNLVRKREIMLAVETIMFCTENHVEVPTESLIAVLKSYIRTHGPRAENMPVLFALFDKAGVEEAARADVSASQVLGALARGELKEAKGYLQQLHGSQGATLGAETYNRIMKSFGKCTSIDGVLETFRIMQKHKIELDADSFEIISNVAVRQVEFIKGAVSMETLPEEGLPEACFAGRSNVGKSSLVNMICNRKKLAFTSKTPGKTQVREDAEMDREHYLVDGLSLQPALVESLSHLISSHSPLPVFISALLIWSKSYNILPRSSTSSSSTEKAESRTFAGYAEVNRLLPIPSTSSLSLQTKVPKAKKEEWLRFYREYLAQRKSLRIFFQLVDGRHGPLQDDLELMKLFAESTSKNPNHVAHAIVITKMDKTLSAKVIADADIACHDMRVQAQENVMENVRDALRDAGCNEETPVLLTSSASKLGRGDVWNYLQLALQDGIEDRTQSLTRLLAPLCEKLHTFCPHARSLTLSSLLEHLKHKCNADGVRSSLP
eukprot:762098-Hanusia_phi.AAC.1